MNVLVGLRRPCVAAAGRIGAEKSRWRRRGVVGHGAVKVRASGCVRGYMTEVTGKVDAQYGEGGRGESRVGATSSEKARKSEGLLDDSGGYRGDVWKIEEKFLDDSVDIASPRVMHFYFEDAAALFVPEVILDARAIARVYSAIPRSKNQTHYFQLKRRCQKVVSMGGTNGKLPSLMQLNKMMGLMNHFTDYSRTLELYDSASMAKESFCPNEWTFNLVLQAHLGLKNDLEALKCLDRAIKEKKVTRMMYNQILQYYSSYAPEEVFEGFLSRVSEECGVWDSLTCLIVLYYWHRGGKMDKVWEFVKKNVLRDSGSVALNSAFYNELMLVLLKEGKLEMMNLVFDRIARKYGMVDRVSEENLQIGDGDGEKEEESPSECLGGADPLDRSDNEYVVNTYTYLAPEVGRGSFSCVEDVCANLVSAPTPSVRSDPRIIASFILVEAMYGKPDRLLKLFEVLNELDVQTDTYFCRMAVHGYSSQRNYEELEKFLVLFLGDEAANKKSGWNVSKRRLCQIALSYCLKNNDLKPANKLFNFFLDVGHKYPSCYEFTCMIALHLSNGEEESALRYFEILEKSLVFKTEQTSQTFTQSQSRPQKSTSPRPEKRVHYLPWDPFRLFVHYYIYTDSPSKAEKFYYRHIRRVCLRYDRDKILQHQLYLMIQAKLGNHIRAKESFDQLLSLRRHPTPEICEHLIEAYIRAQEDKKAITFFEEMLENTADPSIHTYQHIASIHAKRLDVQKLKESLDALRQNGLFSASPAVLNYLLSVYVKLKRWTDALSCLEQEYDWENLKFENDEKKILFSKLYQSLRTSCPSSSLKNFSDQRSQSKPSPNITTFIFAFNICQRMQSPSKLSHFFHLWQTSSLPPTPDFFISLLSSTLNLNPLLFRRAAETLISWLKLPDSVLTFQAAKAVVDQLKCDSTLLSQSSQHYAKLEKFNKSSVISLSPEEKTEFSRLLSQVLTAQSLQRDAPN